MSKSYVTMEQRVCVVCGKTYDTDTLLIDKRLRNTLETHTVTGYGLCPDDTKFKDAGYVALIECDESKSKVGTKTLNGEEVRVIANIDQASRTGNHAHVKSDAFTELFDMPVPEQMIAYVENGMIDKLREIAGPATVDYRSADEAFKKIEDRRKSREEEE